MKNPYTVYLLQCADQTIYTGITTDIARRFKEHAAGDGGNYTRARQPVKILYTESSSSRSSALKREAEIKKWSRLKKLELIKRARRVAPQK